MVFDQLGFFPDKIFIPETCAINRNGFYFVTAQFFVARVLSRCYNILFTQLIFSHRSGHRLIFIKLKHNYHCLFFQTSEAAIQSKWSHPEFQIKSQCLCFQSPPVAAIKPNSYCLLFQTLEAAIQPNWLHPEFQIKSQCLCFQSPHVAAIKPKWSHPEFQFKSHCLYF